MAHSTTHAGDLGIAPFSLPTLSAIHATVANEEAHEISHPTVEHAPDGTAIPAISKRISSGSSSSQQEKRSSSSTPPGSAKDVEKFGAGVIGEDGFTDEERLRESKYLTGKKLAVVFIGMLMSVWLIALDQTILAPALPVIASKFNALDQIAWIASAYFLTQTAFLLLWGQLLTLFDRKWSFLVGIALFEIGSLLCAVAPTVNVLIFGRAFAGVGASSIFVSCLSIIAEVTRLEDRPKLFGLFGAVFAISSVVGPLLGGAFTDHVTWRLCFWSQYIHLLHHVRGHCLTLVSRFRRAVNLPFGAVTVAAILFILGPQPAPPPSPEVIEFTTNKIRRWTFGKATFAPESFIFRLAAIDWLGTWLMLATITCLLLPLQWGGNKYGWRDPIIIGCFCAFAALVIIFVFVEWKVAGPTSILPLRFFRNRSQVGACLEAFCLMFCLLLATYYLPIFFQATKGVSATKSGIDILPYMLGVVVGSAVSGGIVSKEGHYKPWLFFGPWLLCIGAGLLYTIKETSKNSTLIGYQIILALGTGACLQQTIIAVQADCANPDDVPQATALVTFAQLVGGTIGIAISSTVFGSKLSSALKEFAPTAPFDLVRNSVEAVKTLPADIKPAVIHAYVIALNNVFVIAVAAGALASLSALLVRNLSVKGQAMGAGAA
ncbi:BZ3500_MvSof-1268-A1-R1_Chr1-2g01314 [Microbotryum saponariae]|uniref:BZ3500_MvSof-1268-A1-R1_Chr1-2g01314 protein n=1 Tax=Microbotryum saponariae TaxID=289078 RepID=A0A2X0MI66_9BASI|nr:BZ3500_MvSof-1268-A1-R1_Chr1-2g01314 [Microbotryum saponariae]SCZ97071.1 BZ3501_MvSof-1269-A2-R1_Chr1-2g00913 [Microbotryum saponariae]